MDLHRPAGLLHVPKMSLDRGTTGTRPRMCVRSTRWGCGSRARTWSARLPHCSNRRKRGQAVLRIAVPSRNPGGSISPSGLTSYDSDGPLPRWQLVAEAWAQRCQETAAARGLTGVISSSHSATNLDRRVSYVAISCNRRPRPRLPLGSSQSTRVIAWAAHRWLNYSPRFAITSETLKPQRGGTDS